MRKPPAQRAVGKAIHILRKRAGITQEQLALEAGIGRSYLGRLERGECAPTTNLLFKLLPPLKVNCLEFVAEVKLQMK